jgi:hypothetical protein
MFLFLALCVPHSAYADADRNLAERCTDKIFSSVHGKSAAQLLRISSSLFNYEYAARRAASRNRQNWSTLSPAARAAYIKKLRAIAERDVIPRLIGGQTTRGVVVRTYREGSLLVIVYKGGSRIKVSAACIVHDGTSAGVSLSTLAAEALKE